MMIWEKLHPDVTAEHLGFLPSFLDERNPAGAVQQIDANYRHGGGWQSFTGFEFDPATAILSYPGDPPYGPLARTTLRDETIYFYPYAWVLVLQKDGSFDVARID